MLTPAETLAHLAALVDSAEDAIFSQDLDSKIVTWNAGAQRLYGYEAAEIVGKPVDVLFPEHGDGDEALLGGRIRSGERVKQFETIHRAKGGRTIDVSVRMSPVLNAASQVAGISYIVRDIAERRRFDDQVRHLAAIVESSEDAIIGKTLEGVILTWNSGAERVYGYPAAEVIGRHMTLLLPKDRPDEEAAILSQIGRGERVEHFETVRRRKNGELIDVSLTISPIRDDRGRITGASHVARDVTERKRLEDHLRHTQKLESIGVLAGGVAHDFNNLLTGILGNTSLALETLSANNPTRGLLRDVLSASERAALLTRQLLAYAGKGRFVIEPIHLSDLVREISSLIQTSIPKNVQLRLDLRDDLPVVQADASQLQQVIMNLVINAAEAIPDDQNGTVLVTTGLQFVDDGYLQTVLAGSDVVPGTYINLEVHDTGRGMDDATLGRIFDPFFSTKFTGRGLGLAAVQGIVRGHKGAIKVYSRPGKGTTFRILLPASAQAEAPKVSPDPSLTARDELILVIDDEEIIRRTAKSMLERYGYAVVLAENGREGIDLLRVLGNKVSAVLLDMTMPIMGGEEAFEHLKAINPAVRIVVSSGYNEVEAIRRFTGKGIAGFIQKPYSAATLAQRIRAILEQPQASGSEVG